MDDSYTQDVHPGQATTVRTVPPSDVDDVRAAARADYLAALERAGLSHLVGDAMLDHWYQSKTDRKDR